MSAFLGFIWGLSVVNQTGAAAEAQAAGAAAAAEGAAGAEAADGKVV